MSRGRIGISFAEEFRWTFAVRPLDTSKYRGRCSVAVVVSSACVCEMFDISERLGGESEGEGWVRLLELRIEKTGTLSIRPVVIELIIYNTAASNNCS